MVLLFGRVLKLNLHCVSIFLFLVEDICYYSTNDGQHSHNSKIAPITEDFMICELGVSRLLVESVVLCVLCLSGIIVISVVELFVTDPVVMRGLVVIWL